MSCIPCCCSVAMLCPILCEPRNCSMSAFLVLHYLPEFTQSHVHRVSDAIQPSHPLSSPLSSCLQSFPASGSSPMSRLFTLGGQSIGASASVLPMNIQGWFPSCTTGLIIWSPCCPRNSQEYSTTPEFESIKSSALSLIYGLTLTSIHDYWKNHSFD